MATTRRDRVGRVSERLAALLGSVGYVVDAAELNSQNLRASGGFNSRPHDKPYMAIGRDCCSWYVTTTDDSMYLFSYDTMTACVRHGIELSDADDRHVEISAKRPANGREMTRKD